jgi:hypothetical protein
MLTQMVEAEAAIAPLEKAVKAASQAHISEVAQAMVMEKPAPASGVAEAQARLAFGRDRVETLRQARKQIEEDLPGYEEEVIEAETKVENLISQIIADHEVVVLEAAELAKRLKPYRAALLSFVRDHGARPTEWHLQRPYDKGREPLDEAADQVWQFFRDLRESETPAVNPWRKVREGLRSNPDAAVLRHLVNQFDGLLEKPVDAPRSEPAAPT